MLPPPVVDAAPAFLPGQLVQLIKRRLDAYRYPSRHHQPIRHVTLAGRRHTLAVPAAELGQASSCLDHVWEHFDVVPLDKVVPGKVAVLKIDVEGMEEHV